MISLSSWPAPQSGGNRDDEDRTVRICRLALTGDLRFRNPGAERCGDSEVGAQARAGAVHAEPEGRRGSARFAIWFAPDWGPWCPCIRTRQILVSLPVAPPVTIIGGTAAVLPRSSVSVTKLLNEGIRASRSRCEVSPSTRRTASSNASRSRVISASVNGGLMVRISANSAARARS